MNALAKISAAIEAHRIAWETLLDVVEQTGRYPRFQTRKEARFKAARAEFEAATKQLISTQIDSLEGALALLDYLQPFATPGQGAASAFKQSDALEWWDLADALMSVRAALHRHCSPSRRLALAA